jgi:ABC-type phosphate transport system substrate-binding protein
MRRTIVFAIALTHGLGTAATGLAADAGFQVIVHESNPTRSVTKEQLAAFFLKKTPRWPQGGPASPVDQGDSSPARAAFSKDVLGKSVAAVASYWQQQIFSGREVPPPQKNGDAAIVEFVKTNAGAVGYVAADATPAGVKILAVVEE